MQSRFDRTRNRQNPLGKPVPAVIASTLARDA